MPGDRPSVEFSGHEIPRAPRPMSSGHANSQPDLGEEADGADRRTARNSEWGSCGFATTLPGRPPPASGSYIAIGAIEFSCASHAAASAFRTASGSPLIARNKVLAGPLNRFAPRSHSCNVRKLNS